MKAKVLQRSRITRYDGNFSSLSAFLLCPSPVSTDTETEETCGAGTLLLEADGMTLTYREEESGVTVTVEQRSNSLTVTRSGAVLTFQVGARTLFDYRTAYGILSTEAYTESVTLKEKGNTRLITLVYTAVFGGMAQKNEMRFKITT